MHGCDGVRRFGSTRGRRACRELGAQVFQRSPSNAPRGRSRTTDLKHPLLEVSHSPRFRRADTGDVPVVDAGLLHSHPHGLDTVTEPRRHTLDRPTLGPKLRAQGPHHPDRGNLLLRRTPGHISSGSSGRTQLRIERTGSLTNPLSRRYVSRIRAPKRLAPDRITTHANQQVKLRLGDLIAFVDLHASKGCGATAPTGCRLHCSTSSTGSKGALRS